MVTYHDCSDVRWRGQGSVLLIARIPGTLADLDAACARWPGNSVQRGVQVRPRLIPPPVVPRAPFSTNARGVGSSLRWSGIRAAAFMVAYACSHGTQRGRETADRSPSAATVASGAVPPAREGGHLQSALIRCSLTVHAACPSPAIRTEAVSFRGPDDRGGGSSVRPDLSGGI